MGIEDNRKRGKKGERIYELNHPGATRTGIGSDYEYAGELVEVKTGNAKKSPLQEKAGAKVWRIKDTNTLDMVPDPEEIKNSIFNTKLHKKK
jgi:hypothetical protein